MDTDTLERPMTPDQQKVVPREAPQPDEARKALVTAICDDVKSWERHWDKVFKRMRADRRFARGEQWPAAEQTDDGNYVANITIRHLKQRTAAIYARNPKYAVRMREKLWYKIWNGDPAQIEAAAARFVAGQAAAAGADPALGGVPPEGPSEEDIALLMELEQVALQKRQLEAYGDTVRLMLEYFAGEQNRPVKRQMKRMVQRAHTVGVAYVRPSYQRTMGRRPEDEQALADERRKLESLERISADIADGEEEPDGAEAERLRVKIAALEKQPEILIREGLAFEYPDPTTIIPDLGLTSILGFEGCRKVAEKHLMTPKRVQEVYGVDITSSYTSRRDDREFVTDDNQRDQKLAAVYEVWDQDDGMVYVICDGYPDFLVEPSEPDVWTEQFFPWHVYAPNWNDDDENPFPPSDVTLIRDMQMEVNRAGEALRDHRYAARPGWLALGAISPETALKMERRGAHQVVSAQELTGKKVEDLFAPFPTPGIDPNLYTTAPAMEDIQRTVGTQEANLGGISGGTATEVSLAEGSRQSALTSSRDELDDLLTHLARTCGQIIVMEVDQATVMEICGPGAQWPEAQDRKTVAKEVMLEVEAGSTGRPNQAQQVQSRERIMPLLLQVPGINPLAVAKDLVRVMDDSIRIEDWISTTPLSITALNGQAQAMANAQREPGAQGNEGGSNAPRPPGRQSSGMPRNERGG